MSLSNSCRFLSNTECCHSCFHRWRNVADTCRLAARNKPVPMVRYFMAGELTDNHKAEFQKFIDFSTEVGTVPEKVDITKYLQAY